jgi:hypothetical protein
MWMIIAISVFAYLVAGMATATMVILIEGEPKDDGVEIILAAVLFWPIAIMIDGPFWMARWIKAKREASREKPHVFSEYDEP